MGKRREKAGIILTSKYHFQKIKVRYLTIDAHIRILYIVITKTSVIGNNSIVDRYYVERSVLSEHNKE